MKKVLVLSYSDNPAEGHALFHYKEIRAKGHEAYFVSLVSEFTHNTPAYFIDCHKKLSATYLSYKFKRRLRKLFSPVVKGTKEYCFFNQSNYYIGDTKKILSKVPFIPEVIIIGWTDYFISPKIIYELYRETHAKIVIPMLDHHLLGGGCHYPCECNQYQTGCKKCPALQKKKIASNLYDEKIKYFQDIPLTIVGTAYDIKRAQKVPFLKNKEILSNIGTPNIPIIKSKSDAKKEFGIDDGDFVVMCGAYSIRDKRKGFLFLLEALQNFSTNITERKVALLLLGDGSIDVTAIDDKISIVSPGFLNLEKLFVAYYAADVFISPSVDDSGPYMVNYSIACGTPVISFPIGIALDLVKHLETGYLATFLDAASIADGLREFYEMQPEHYDKISKNCLNLMERLRKESEPWYMKVLE